MYTLIIDGVKYKLWIPKDEENKILKAQIEEMIVEVSL